MKITERHIYVFEVEAGSREEAIKLIYEELNAHPKLKMTPASEVSSEFNAMQILLLEDLAKAIGMKEGQFLAAFIKEKTDLDMTPQNFKEIVPILEQIKAGTPKVTAKATAQ